MESSWNWNYQASAISGPGHQQHGQQTTAQTPTYQPSGNDSTSESKLYSTQNWSSNSDFQQSNFSNWNPGSWSTTVPPPNANNNWGQTWPQPSAAQNSTIQNQNAWPNNLKEEPGKGGNQASNSSSQVAEFDESKDAELVEFDKQFKTWETQFLQWKEENKDHPDKAALTNYEETWKNWRDELLQKRESIKKNKLQKLQDSAQVQGSIPIPPSPTSDNSYRPGINNPPSYWSSDASVTPGSQWATAPPDASSQPFAGGQNQYSGPPPNQGWGQHYPYQQYGTGVQASAFSQAPGTPSGLPPKAPSGPPPAMPSEPPSGPPPDSSSVPPIGPPPGASSGPPFGALSGPPPGASSGLPAVAASVPPPGASSGQPIRAPIDPSSRASSGLSSSVTPGPSDYQKWGGNNSQISNWNYGSQNPNWNSGPQNREESNFSTSFPNQGGWNYAGNSKQLWGQDDPNQQPAQSQNSPLSSTSNQNPIASLPPPSQAPWDSSRHNSNNSWNYSGTQNRVSDNANQARMNLAPPTFSQGPPIDSNDSKQQYYKKENHGFSYGGQLGQSVPTPSEKIFGQGDMNKLPPKSDPVSDGNAKKSRWSTGEEKRDDFDKNVYNADKTRSGNWNDPTSNQSSQWSGAQSSQNFGQRQDFSGAQGSYSRENEFESRFAGSQRGNFNWNQNNRYDDSNLNRDIRNDDRDSWKSSSNQGGILNNNSNLLPNRSLRGDNERFSNMGSAEGRDTAGVFSMFKDKRSREEGGIPGLDVPQRSQDPSNQSRPSDQNKSTSAADPSKRGRNDSIGSKSNDDSIDVDFDESRRLNIGPIGVDRKGSRWKPPQDWYEDDEENDQDASQKVGKSQDEYKDKSYGMNTKREFDSWGMQGGRGKSARFDGPNSVNQSGPFGQRGGPQGGLLGPSPRMGGPMNRPRGPMETGGPRSMGNMGGSRPMGMGGPGPRSHMGGPGPRNHMGGPSPRGDMSRSGPMRMGGPRPMGDMGGNGPMRMGGPRPMGDMGGSGPMGMSGPRPMGDIGGFGPNGMGGRGHGPMGMDEPGPIGMGGRGSMGMDGPGFPMRMRGFRPMGPGAPGHMGTRGPAGFGSRPFGPRGGPCDGPPMDNFGRGRGGPRGAPLRGAMRGGRMSSEQIASLMDIKFEKKSHFSPDDDKRRGSSPLSRGSREGSHGGRPFFEQGASDVDHPPDRQPSPTVVTQNSKQNDNYKYSKSSKGNDGPKCDVDSPKIASPAAEREEVVTIDDLISVPGRFMRPPKLLIVLRGLPGAGKSTIAKLIKEREIENGGSAPRILCLDDYFMVEVEKLVTDPETGRKIKTKVMQYEYEFELEGRYREALFKSFRKRVDDGFSTFIILDCINCYTKDYQEICTYARNKDFEVYVGEIKVDVQTCFERNVHNRKFSDLQKMSFQWQQPLPRMIPLDLTSYIQDATIDEVEMEDCIPVGGEGGAGDFQDRTGGDDGDPKTETFKTNSTVSEAPKRECQKQSLTPLKIGSNSPKNSKQENPNQAKNRSAGLISKNETSKVQPEIAASC